MTKNDEVDKRLFSAFTKTITKGECEQSKQESERNAINEYKQFPRLWVSLCIVQNGDEGQQ